MQMNQQPKNFAEVQAKVDVYTINRIVSLFIHSGHMQQKVWKLSLIITESKKQFKIALLKCKAISRKNKAKQDYLK